MQSNSNKPVFWEYLTKLALTGVFLALFGLFVAWRAASGQPLDLAALSATDLLLLAFASLRTGRLLAYDLVTEPLRQPFTRTVKDVSGAGDTVVARGKGFQRAIGQLICCPICSATWAGALMVYALLTWPGPARLFVTLLGVLGIAELLNSAIEALTWNGTQARVRTGVLLGELHKQPPAEAKPGEHDVHLG